MNTELMIPEGESEKRMDSREIAEITGKLHKHVLKDIDAMLERLELHSAGFSAQYKDSTGRNLRCYNLPFGLTMLLVGGYSEKFRIQAFEEYFKKGIETGRKIAAIELAKTMDERMLITSGILEKIQSPDFKMREYSKISDLPYTSVYEYMPSHGMENNQNVAYAADAIAEQIHIFAEIPLKYVDNYGMGVPIYRSDIIADALDIALGIRPVEVELKPKPEPRRTVDFWLKAGMKKDKAEELAEYWRKQA
jgi:phage regulator Rha-like protein